MAVGMANILRYRKSLCEVFSVFGKILLLKSVVIKFSQYPPRQNFGSFSAKGVYFKKISHMKTSWKVNLPLQSLHSNKLASMESLSKSCMYCLFL